MHGDRDGYGKYVKIDGSIYEGWWLRDQKVTKKQYDEENDQDAP